MGLFMQRPEEPSEWAGLPSEPDRPESSAEKLGDAARVDSGSVDLLGGSGAAIESIVIPVPPATRMITFRRAIILAGFFIF